MGSCYQFHHCSSKHVASCMVTGAWDQHPMSHDPQMVFGHAILSDSFLFRCNIWFGIRLCEVSLTINWFKSNPLDYFFTCCFRIALGLPPLLLCGCHGSRSRPTRYERLDECQKVFMLVFILFSIAAQ